MKRITGFVRETGTGAPLQNISVTVRDDIGGTAIPAGGMYGASANPINTDANGKFTWTTELSPGPLRVEAEIIVGVELDVRSGQEGMQIGGAYTSDVESLFLDLKDGVLKGVGSDFLVTPVVGVRQVTVNPGAANMGGALLQTHSNRSLTIAANTTLTTRRDYVVLEQHVGGTYYGRQNIAVVQGTANNVLPTLNTNPNILQWPLYTVTIPLNATSVTVTDVRVYAEPRFLVIPNGTITVDHLANATKDYIAAAFPGTTFKDANVSRGLFKTVNVAGAIGAVVNGSQIDIGIKNKGITGAMIADDTIGAGQIAANAIGTSELATDSVTAAKIAASAVGASEIADGSITAVEIANGTITPNKMHTSWRPFILKSDSDADTNHSANVDLSTTSFTSVSGASYVWMAWAFIRATGEVSSVQVRGWLRIMWNNAEQSAEFFYLPADSYGGGSVQVQAAGTFTRATGQTETFATNWARDQGTLRVNQRTLMVWVQRVA